MCIVEVLYDMMSARSDSSAVLQLCEENGHGLRDVPPGVVQE